MSDPELIYSSHVFCCTNLRPEGAKRGSCAAKGSEKLRNYMKARAKELGLEPKVRVNSAGCLERCELGPALVIYPEGVWYTFTSQEDIDEILQTHVIDGRRVERLMLMPGQTEPRPESLSVAPA
ncbi:(2Fe-2S) ferredoxin domain-containing protein [Skermanella pratensis]|uniref:(2Fe-2S) ferredoxin domain-containing protein n=1 Tax=Skermanella pratensis TaxID=2233999 RepID=UPI0013012FC5|nr:(2Fe-2S) ferredoxin domain-containing protein [Skermanella pratensis]